MPESRALYLHVPFCSSICGYCDFCRTIYREDAADRWLGRILEDLESVRGTVRTIYLGGGTPTALTEGQLEKLCSSLERFHPVEWTCEANPESCTEEKVRILAKHGVNRVSLGVQSFSEKNLEALERRHRRGDVRRAVLLLRKMGIRNISFDLIYSIPSQTLEEWREDLEKAASFQVPHISLYSLTIEEHSRFAREKKEPLDNETEYEMYRAAISYLAERGYRQYEISSFSFPGYESRHNLAYWHYEDFIGIGVGASGKEGRIRYTRTGTVPEYIRHEEKEEIVRLSEKDERFEAIMMGLRLNEGINRKDFQKRFGIDPVEGYPEAVRRNARNGLLSVEKDAMKVTDQGRFLLNDVLEEFME